MNTKTLQRDHLVVQTDTVSNAPQPDLTAAVEFVKLQQQAARGANWFFWIAGLSIVNLFLVLNESGINFPVGLATVQIPVGLGAAGGSGPTLILGLVFSAAVAALFVFFGVMSRKGHEWAFIAGLVLYGIDGLLFLLFLDIIAVGFHALAFFGVYHGLKATGQLASQASHRPAGV